MNREDKFKSIIEDWCVFGDIMYDYKVDSETNKIAFATYYEEVLSVSIHSSFENVFDTIFLYDITEALKDYGDDLKEDIKEIDFLLEHIKEKK